MSVISVTPTVLGAGTPVGQLPSNAVAVTPSDTNTYSSPVSIYVGGAGNVSIVPWDSGPGGAAVVFVAPPVGTVIPCRAIIVTATNTTATNLVAIS